MKKFSLLVFCGVFLLATLACSGGNLANSLASKFERGEISFVTPVEGSKLHQDGTGEVPYIPVSISSTFDTDKDVRLTINGLGPVSCLAKANQTSPCPNLPYQEYDNYLRAETFKMDGVTVVSAETSFNWTPYSSLDKFVTKVTGNAGGDPTSGYLLIAFLVSVSAAVFLALKGGQWGAILGFFLPLFGLAFFTSQSGSAVTTVVLQGVFGLAGAGLLLVGVYFWLKSGQTATAPQFEKAWVETPDGHKFGAERSHWGQIGPGEFAPQSGDLPTKLIEGARSAGVLGLPDKESYDTPLRLKE